MVRFDSFDNWSLKELTDMMGVIKRISVFQILLISGVLVAVFLKDLSEYAPHIIIFYISNIVLSLLLAGVIKKLDNAFHKRIQKEYLIVLVKELDNELKKEREMGVYAYLRKCVSGSDAFNYRIIMEIVQKIKNMEMGVHNDNT